MVLLQCGIIVPFLYYSVRYALFTSHKNLPPAAVLRSPCPLPHRCLLPLATAASKTLPPLTTTPAAACHPAQHNNKGGRCTINCGLVTAAACQRRQGGRGVTTTAATNDDKVRRGCCLPLPSPPPPSIAIAKCGICCDGTC